MMLVAITIVSQLLVTKISDQDPSNVLEPLAVSGFIEFLIFL